MKTVASLSCRIALRLTIIPIRILSAFVPGHRRQTWREEWEAELAHRCQRMESQGTTGISVFLDLVRFALAAVPDALHLVRHERTVDSLLLDIRFGMRSLAKRPGFTLTAVLTLALGIGANSAVFSVVNGVVLRPLPYADSESLVRVREVTPEGYDFSVSPPNFFSLREEATLLSDVVAFLGTSMTLTGTETPERVYGMRVSRELFQLLGGSPVLGRTFTAEEEETAPDPALILSHGAWQRRFGESPEVLGSTMVLDGVSRTVVGVLPAGFEFVSSATELWLPLEFSERDLTLRGRHFLGVLGRLESGAGLTAAQEELNAIWTGMEEAFPDTNAGWRVTAAPLLDEILGDARARLLILLGAVGFVLLIACANVANLSLARAEKRGRELAIRSALGGSRGRLVRQQLVENGLLGILGGAVGLALAHLATGYLLRFFQNLIPRLDEVTIDHRTLLFTFVVSITAGLLTGLAPMAHGMRKDLGRVLNETGHAAGRWIGRGRVRGAFVVAEVALCLMLVTGTGLLLNSFWRLTRVDVGFTKENLLVGNISLPEASYPTPESRDLFFQNLPDALERHPDVVSAGAIFMLPLTGAYTHVFSRLGLAEDEEWRVQDRPVTPGYFRTMGMQLLAGRFLSEQDHATAPLVAVVNEAIARQLFPEESVVGQRIKWTGNPDTEGWEIVGVVKDTREFGLDSDAPMTLYRPHSQINPPSDMAIVVRSHSSPLALATSVRQAVSSIDQTLPVYGITTMESVVAASLASERVLLLLLGIFAAVAVALGVVGVYGVMSYTVSQRTREVGIRIAMGGAPRDVRGLVMRQGMTLVLMGVILGLVGAVSLGRVLRGMLYEVAPADPKTLAVVSGIVALVSLVACHIPARRAAAVDPTESLRQE